MRTPEDLTQRQVKAFARLVSAYDRYNSAHNERLDAQEAFWKIRQHAQEMGIDVSDYTIC